MGLPEIPESGVALVGAYATLYPTINAAARWLLKRLQTQEASTRSRLEALETENAFLRQELFSAHLVLASEGLEVPSEPLVRLAPPLSLDTHS